MTWVPAGLPPADGESGYLCQRNFLSQEGAKAVLEQAKEAFSDPFDWRLYSDHARTRMLQALQLDPLPRRSLLKVVRHSYREFDGYSVENIAIETIPGFWLTGNLYRPTRQAPPHAAVLHTHGHSGGVDGDQGWAGHGRFKADVQARAAALAKMGAVSLTIDMVGYGDQTTIMGLNAHRSAHAATLQLWNGVRALDYLESLPGVDARRIGITGHSGGATQGFLLSALDRRVSVQVSVAMISAHFFGGCACESGIPLHRSEDHFLSNPMIAAMMAPRPLQLISVGGDWSVNTPQVEFPFIQSIYAGAGFEARVSNVHLADEGHNYGPSKRQAMYPFMAEWLGLDLSALQGEDGKLSEDAITIESPEAMRVFGPAHAVPDSALKSSAGVMAQLRKLQSPQ